MSEQTIIVDSNDVIIGKKDRAALNTSDIYRVSALWIKNTKGESLLAKRSFLKTRNPGKWGPAVAGTNADGETYEENIRREAKEEIGIDLSDIPLKMGPKRHVKGEYEYFAQWYLAIIDLPLDKFSIDPDEVDQVKWFAPEEVRQALKGSSEDFLATFKDSFESFN